MTTMELDAQRLVLVREILNTDDVRFVKEMSEACRRIKSHLAKSFMGVLELEAEDDKEYVISGLKEAFMQVNDIRSGKVQGRPAEDLLKELQAEAEA